MKAPRIIIADTDIDYIIPLQLKFIESFLDKINLEIITDAQYLTELFSAPQKADVLVISEMLYASSIQRHNIAHVFIMTEQHKEEDSGNPDTKYIYKYTSIMEIFNEIIGQSAGSLNIETESKLETQTALVYSAKGGVGKTTVAMGIAASLTKSYKRVLYINVEHLQSFQHILENQSPITSATVYSKLSGSDTLDYNDIKYVIRKEIFYYLPPFKTALMSLGLKYSLFEKIIASAKKSMDFDFIVVDTDTAFDDDKARLIDIADKVIIVTDQTEASVYATNLFVANINCSGDKFIFICNNFDRETDNALIRQNIPLRFTVNDYIEHLAHYDKLKCSDFANDKGVQKVAFLVM